MYERETISESSSRIEAAWASGRICVYAAWGMRARIQEAQDLVAAGLLDQEQAYRNAREAEEVAYAFGPQGRRR